MVMLIKAGESYKIWNINFQYKPLCILKEPALGNYSAFYHLFTYILKYFPLYPLNLHYL